MAARREPRPERRVTDHEQRPPAAEPPATELPPAELPPAEPIAFDDEDGLFAAHGESTWDGHWPDAEERAAAEARVAAARAEQDRVDRARRSRNPIVRITATWPRWLRVSVDWVATIAGAIAIVLAIKAYVVNPYRIPSSSMEPTLHCARPGSGCEARFSDRVLANRFIYHFRSPQRGDIIVFKTPPAAAERCGAGGTFVKRLIALPGEKWEERNGFVYINGKRLVEPYVKANRRDSGSYPVRRIPEGKYFFMGDNRSQSCDSREWGAVPRTNIIGEVFFVYWPPFRIGFRAALILLGFVLVLPLATGRRGFGRA
jgi:signal peptidase I